MLRAAGCLWVCGWLLLGCATKDGEPLGMIQSRGPDAGDNGEKPGGTDPDRDAGLDGSVAALGFGHLAVDATSTPVDMLAQGGMRMTPSETPDGWLCALSLGRDAVCDCGCGVVDLACPTPGCSAAGCSTAACEACFDAAGALIPCGEPDTWTCRGTREEDGVCDCGCGIPDPDCDAGGCTEPGCFEQACERCIDAAGATAVCEELSGSACDAQAFGDGICDCGCGQPDPDCGTGACSEPGCDALACEVCHGSEGEVLMCPTSASGWTCESGARTDGVCDCGCGIADPDCAEAGCAEPGCSTSACGSCHDAFGRELPCSDTWSCQARRFGDGVCDCGCGASDPDCDGAGCADGGCEAAACERRFDAQGTQLVPPEFTCDPAVFGADDGCHCGCGATDPDCEPGPRGCDEPGCRDATCDVCLNEAGDAVDCRWRCDDALQADGACDCGCGARDPDCNAAACIQPACFDAACDTCHAADGAVLECAASACAIGFKQNGVCDCGCAERDPECRATGSCVTPGCADRACHVCHAADGAVIPCKSWECTFEQQGGGDGCNCGCGALDPDCAPAAGCSEPGCAEEVCGTCRSAAGAPTECDP